MSQQSRPRRATAIGNNNLGPGKPIKEVWQAIRDHLDQTEFATVGDVSGHCIGLDLHERPFILPDETTEMKPGMVTTMEPGIYVFGFGGVRIEDDVLITADGAEVLTGFTRDLLVVGQALALPLREKAFSIGAACHESHNSAE